MACEQLDLSQVIRRVASENPDWTQQRLDDTVHEYRRWLYLAGIAKRGTPLGMGATAGSKDVDTVWHAHILFTKKYEQDCLRAAGRFIHHTPADPADESDGGNTYANTLRLYEKTFGSRPAIWFEGWVANATGTFSPVKPALESCGCRGTNSCNQCSSNCRGTTCQGGCSSGCSSF